MFRRLLEEYARSAAARDSAEGYLVSFVAHLVIVGGAFLGARETHPLAVPATTFSPVQYLIPKEQLAGSRPQAEQISWLSVETMAGSGYEEKKDEPKDKAALEVPVAKGEEKQVDKGDEPPEPQPPIPLGDSIKTEIEVDSVVTRYENSAAPPYPESMLTRRIEGMVIVQYVVDSTGHADTATFRVLSATHRDFARSVKNTLPMMRFHPAIMANKRVAQLVEQPFVFKIVDTARVAKKPSGQ